MEDAAKKGERLVYDGREVVLGSYRPFCKQWVYYDRVMNEMTYQQPAFFLSRKAREKGRKDLPAAQYPLKDVGKRRGRNDLPAGLSPMP